MRWLLVISFTICFLNNTSAQLGKGWQVYFSENVDSLYTAMQYKIRTTAYFRYPVFEEYPTFNLTVYEEGDDEKINRLGLLLNAKSTKTFYFTGEAIYGNELDSVRIWYNMKAGIVRKGRSAMVSIMNLLSKEEDKSPQEEPYHIYSKPIKRGFIEFKDEQILFSTDTLYRGSHSIILQNIKKVKKHKTGKIKKANSFVFGQQLMKGDTCLAVIDSNTWPITLYFLKSLNYKDRLIYTAFLTINGLSIINREEEE